MGKAIRQLASQMSRFGKNASPTGPSTGPAHGSPPQDASRNAGLARRNRGDIPAGGRKGKSI